MNERPLAPVRWTTIMRTEMSPAEAAVWDDWLLSLRDTRPGNRLAMYLASLGPFDWAAFNCCHFAAGWLVVNGQPDAMAGLRATPTLRAARRLVRELGGIVAACSKALGREAIPATFAGVGDIVHIPLGKGFTLGICNGRQAVCIDEAGAFSWVPMSDASCAWRLKP